MSPIPFPPEKGDDDKPGARFWFNLAALIIGAALLVVGGIYADPISQTAGGTIMATVVGVIGWRVSRPGPRL
tara:strand:- start:8615 stop:8830 length:216 start_codon:yes stop_codon:yes gene_type:complete